MGDDEAALHVLLLQARVAAGQQEFSLRYLGLILHGDIDRRLASLVGRVPQSTHLVD